jgi:hypothetical protein
MARMNMANDYWMQGTDRDRQERYSQDLLQMESRFGRPGETKQSNRMIIADSQRRLDEQAGRQLPPAENQRMLIGGQVAAEMAKRPATEAPKPVSFGDGRGVVPGPQGYMYLQPDPQAQTDIYGSTPQGDVFNKGSGEVTFQAPRNVTEKPKEKFVGDVVRYPGGVLGIWDPKTETYERRMPPNMPSTTTMGGGGFSLTETSGGVPLNMDQIPVIPSENMSQADRQALEWANANPNDPRSKQIRQKFGF